MIRKYKYTVLSLMFAVLFIFGSMIVMKYIWKLRETQLLTERGKVEVESPVREWPEWGSGGEPASDNTRQERHELTFTQTEEAVRHWNSREGNIIHEPVAGQISMEEAVESGKKWLAAMGFTPDADDVLTYSVRATLSVGEKRETLNTKLEPYYSFWSVQYANHIMEAEISVNAVTGKVWGAKVTIYEDVPEKLNEGDAKTFWEMAGLQVSETDFSGINAEQTAAVYGAEGTSLHARIVHSQFKVNEDLIVDYNNLYVFHKKYVVITYELVTDEE